MKRLTYTAMAFFVAAAACEGPTGPAGDPGPGEWSYYEGRLNDSGGALVDGIPGSADALPMVQCSVRGESSVYWNEAETCAVDAGTTTVTVVTAGPPNGYYHIAVVTP